MNILELRDIKKKYIIKSKDNTSSVEIDALDGVSLSIEEGQFVAIIGPSGSGKSTLMQIMGLLDKPSSGKLIFMGQDISKCSDDKLCQFRRNYIGFVFQFFNLLAKTTALENVNLPLIYQKRSSLKKAKDLLTKVGLSNRLYHVPSQLSGGQQQRVAIARALITDPKIIFADEPTGNINQQQSQEVMNYFYKLNKQGTCIVLVTHDPKVASHAKRIITIVDGKITSDKINENFSYPDTLDNLTWYQEVAKKIQSEPKTKSFLSGFISFISSLINPAFLKENIKVAFRALFTNKFRTSLSILGISMGIAAVVTMVALGEGAKQSMAAEWESLGTNVIQIRRNFRPGPAQSGQKKSKYSFISEEDFEAIRNLRQKLPQIEALTPELSSSGIIASNNSSSWSVSSFMGVGTEYMVARNLKLEAGRFFTEGEDQKKERVCLIGRTVYLNLFKNNINPVGKYIYFTINITKKKKTLRLASRFKIIGVLRSQGSNSWQDKDDVVLIPYSTAKYRFLGGGGKNIGTITVKTKSTEDLPLVKDRISQVLASRRSIPVSMLKNERDLPFRVQDMTQMIQKFSASTNTMSTLLGIVALISLFVGGIGIMNIMLVSVKERTREIGLRKALGARSKDVLFQFVIESIVVSLLGGVIGSLLGTIVSLIVSLWWYAPVSVGTIFISMVFSLCTAVFFGYWPARQAAKLSPIEALRYE